MVGKNSVAYMYKTQTMEPKTVACQSVSLSTRKGLDWAVFYVPANTV